MQNSETETPLVSVWMITYNHEKYIAQAIEGVLMQKTNFKIELIIGEDCSTDNTAQIIKEYAKKYPSIIKPRFNQPNMGVMPNMIKTLNECTGKYIALCEGDDYWTDPYKLQKQVDFLEENEEYAGAAHQAQVIFEDSKKAARNFKEVNKSVLQIEDLLEGRKFHTASFIFKTEIIKQHSLPSDVTAGDRALFFLIASFGKIYYSQKPMCCYRKNNGGISHWVSAEMMEKDLNMVPWILKINSNFPKHNYYTFIHSTVMDYPNYISKQKIIKHSFWYIYHSFSDFPKNIKQIGIFLLKKFPAIWSKSKNKTI